MTVRVHEASACTLERACDFLFVAVVVVIVERKVVVGCWLLVIGCWWLMVDGWWLVVGS